MKKITLFVFAEKEEIEHDKFGHLLVKKIFEINNITLSIFFSKELNKEYALLICGVGKSNSSFALTNAINKLESSDYFVSNIINIGPVGSLCKNEIGKAFLVEKCYFFDVNLTFIPNYKLGQLPNNEYLFKTSNDLNNFIFKKHNLSFKNILSADKFFSKDDIQTIENNFKNIDLVDMEICSLVNCAIKLNKKISSIKIVSDILIEEENSYLAKANIWKNEIKKIFLFILKEI
ncbi:5'-methylthioadenosine nucleosidase [Metamycoplasma canadense]|uniref:5-methylthioadenosine nucleosidase/S-adenosylhomocystein nucleosidase n=1 Tax=Metamycoplasma canadense TaxID=29554 RepID=A0A077L904_9BACT|nr:5'-methylthioadenosine nucleosidase [Metamycoplasma canadense]BAP39478.1 5-methylthioadenosine nucleosidase/S-adenosylhomocystein nucleosidase [Metamycoplasma canadense]